MNTAIDTKDITRFATTTILCFAILTACQFTVSVMSGSDFEPNWVMNVIMSMAGAFGEWIGVQRRLKKA